jgi:hypothetical protein
MCGAVCVCAAVDLGRIEMLVGLGKKQVKLMQTPGIKDIKPSAS